MILAAAHINDSSRAGNKTKNLARLMKVGFLVPPFVAIPSDTLFEFSRKSKDIASWDLKILLGEIVKALPVSLYAVRSSALIEDSSKKSYAGQFLTKVQQAPEALEKALKEVIVQAFQYLEGNLDQFSLIIQEYIEPDFAGVTFTRDPAGGREMVMEYHQGKGEELVGGAIKPYHRRFYWNQADIRLSLPHFPQAFESFKKIEELFGFPQDIEWLVKDGVWYFLQSRPLTTLAEKDYKQALFLDKALPSKKDFFFEKTEISEIAPRPTAITLSLLEKIYGIDGPVQKVYRKYGIGFHPRSFLKIVGNESYIDREEEIATLLPAYSVLGHNDYKPHLAHISGLARTLRNLLALSFLSPNNRLSLKEEIFKRLEKKLFDSFQEALEDFMNTYERIFEINLLAQKCFTLAGSTLRRVVDAPPLIELLPMRDFVNNEDFLDVPESYRKERWQGNGLELSDETPFHSPENSAPSSLTKKEWLSSLPSFKRKYIVDMITQAAFLNRLREYGRWLTVRHIHHLRMLVLEMAKGYKLENPRDIFFAPVSEILNQKFSKEILQERRIDYERYFTYQFPPKLSGKPLALTHRTLGVSPGKTKGILTDLVHLQTTKDPILFTSLLSPDLTQYFSQLKGIVSEQGGMLSHLAIVARESHIPVLVNVNLKRAGLILGDSICIDGTTGEIKKL